MSTEVDQIKQRLNIVDVVGEYVPLKKTGANHKGLCPFHNESTPSFSVSETKQFYYCFGCGQGGDVFSFIQNIEGIEFPEALRLLAQKAGVELRQFSPKDHNKKSRLLDCLGLANQFFQTARTTETAEPVRDYLASRDIIPATIEQFGLGYSPDSWDALLTHLRHNGYTNDEIEQAGLSIRSEKTGGWYDRFRNRLMFPIHNQHGNVIGFGARTLQASHDGAKYINSPQTDVYNKSAVLYGLHLAKSHIQAVDATVLVEGYMDVIRAHQANIRNLVAASGTALTTDQIQLLKRYSSNILLAFDGDAAGLNAAWKGMQLAIQAGMNIKVIQLPAGQDPDDVIRNDPNSFRALARAAKPFMDYAFAASIGNKDLTDVQVKKQVAGQLLPMIQLYPDSIEQSHYIQKLAKALQVNPELLQARLTRAPQTAAVATPRPQAQPQPTLASDHATRLLEQIIALVSLQPQLYTQVRRAIGPVHIAGSSLAGLYNALETVYTHAGTLQCDQLQFPDTTSQNRWRQLQMIGEERYGELPPKDIQREIASLLQALQRDRITLRLAQLQNELAAAEHTNNMAAIATLTTEFQSLTEQLAQFE